MDEAKSIIQRNVAQIRAEIAASAANSGRNADQVQLVAVTKYVDEALTRIVFESGCETLGESRPQDLWKKAAAMADLPIRWHLIGHLQRNKVKKTIPITTCIESVDSVRLAGAIDRESGDSKVSVLLEVNVSGEEAKHGFLPEQLDGHLAQISQFESLHVCGLMAMAGRGLEPSETRRQFASLRELRDQLVKSAPDNVGLEHLSMGMSGDFQLAIEEGATLVRVGSRLFEGIEQG